MEPKKVTLEDGATPRKVVARSKGSARHYNDGSFEYSPYESTGESSREMLVRKGDSSTYVTRGKTPYRVVMLKEKADDPALRPKMEQQLEDFIRGFGEGNFEEPKPQKKRSALRTLWDSQQMKVELNEASCLCLVRMAIPLNTVEDMKQRAYNHMMNLNQCFTINKQFLVRAVRAQKRTSQG